TGLASASATQMVRMIKMIGAITVDIASAAVRRLSWLHLERISLDGRSDQLHDYLGDAQIVEMRLDRQPSEQILRQRQLDDLLPAPVLHPQRKLRAMLRHGGPVARLLWREAVARPRASQANPEPGAGNL